MSDGSVAEDHARRSRPSSETPLHRSIYAMGDAGAIVHTHAHYCTVLSTLVDELPAVHYAITALGGPVRVARYETFGTDALARSVCEALRDRRGALMANHGAVVVGRDIDHAVALAIQLEWLASIHYHALCAGTPQTLSEDQLGEVVTHARAIDYGLDQEG
jgi:L-fuculose-phosphate aldolase